jgi:peptidoglycan/LPS O-acetylase OafA/YrhL
MAASIDQASELRSARVESLRALAALGVLVGHTMGTAYDYDTAYTLGGDYPHRLIFGGGFGVYLFFALSGYLLFLPFARRDFGGGWPIDLRRYALNRALRILPLYYAVLILLMLVQEGGGTPKQWLLFTTFGQNFTGGTLLTVDGVMWSLVVEVHFYLLLPLLAWLVARSARGSAARAAAAVAALGLASFALRWAVFYADPATANQYLRYSIATTFMFFTVGMLIALLRTARSRVPGPAAAWLAASAALWALVAYDYSLEALCAVAAFLLVGACVLPLRPTRLLRPLEWPALAAVGVSSYSLYLWHVPMLRLIDDVPGLVEDFPRLLAVTVPVCVAAAFASYAAIEAPFLRLRRRWGSTAAAPGLPIPATAEQASNAITGSSVAR